jgi:hypothetical protein
MREHTVTYLSFGTFPGFHRRGLGLGLAGFAEVSNTSAGFAMSNVADSVASGDWEEDPEGTSGSLVCAAAAGGKIRMLEPSPM